jgi:hypothetical protein
MIGDLMRRCPSLLFLCALLAIVALSSGCGNSTQEQSEIRYTRGARQASRITYSYQGQFGLFGIPDGAQAFDGTILLAEAKALRIIKATSGPNQIEIEETHYSSPGIVSYRGLLRIRFGFGGGHVDEEIPISGRKESAFFVSWPSGS